MKIRDIASIQSWFFLRTQSEGSAVYLQAKHFDDNGDIRPWILIPDLKEGLQERHILRTNDILFVAKGTRSFATVYKKEYWPCIASSTFFIVRIKSDQVIPEYIALILNQSQNKTYFKNHFSGSTIPSIPKSVLEEFEIPIPSIEKQKKLVTLYELYKKAALLRVKIEEKKHLLINKIILSPSNS